MAVLMEVVYVAQNSDASVEDRIICRRQLLWLHTLGPVTVGVGEGLEKDVGISTLDMDDDCKVSKVLGAAVEYSTGEELRDVADPTAVDVVCAGSKEVSYVDGTIVLGAAVE